MKIRALTLLCAIALIVCALCNAPTTAYALSIPDIVNMAKQNIPEDTIVELVLASEPMPALTQDDVQSLRTAGLGEKTLRAISSKQNSPKTPSPSPEPSKEPVKTEQNSLPIQPQAPTPSPIPLDAAHTAPQDNLPPQNTNSLENFTQLQPAQTGNLPTILQKFYATAYQNFLIHAEVAAQYDSLKAKHHIAQTGTDLLPTLQTLQKKWSTDPQHVLSEGLRIENENTFEQGALAQAMLDEIIGFSAHRLKLYHRAAKHLDRALQYHSTLKSCETCFLAYLESAKITGHIHTNPAALLQHRASFSKNNQDALLYTAAYAYTFGPQNKGEEASQLLTQITHDPVQHAKALILTASQQILPPQNQFKSAAQNFNKAKELLEKFDTDEAQQLRNTANLGLARIMFENGEFDVAHTLYALIPPQSHHFLQARLENAWSLYFAKNYAQALAGMQVFYQPAQYEHYTPEVPILEAAALLKLCRYDAATAALERFKSSYLLSLDNLLRLLASPNAKYLAQLQLFVQDPKTSALDPRLFNALLQEPSFQKAYLNYMQYRDEHKRCTQLQPQTQSLAKLCQDYQADELAAQNALEQTSKISLERIKAQIQALDITATETSIEIQLALRAKQEHCLKLVAQGKQCEEERATPTSSFFIMNNTQFWEFNSEYWRDELLSYASQIPSLCPQ